MSFIKSRTYKWREILDGVNSAGALPYYLVRRRTDDVVVAACLVIGINPRAPYEIIPARGPQIRKYADQFCRQSEPIRVFVKELDSKWYYRGWFKRVSESTETTEIKLRGKQASRTEIYKIIFLTEVQP